MSPLLLFLLLKPEQEAAAAAAGRPGLCPSEGTARETAALLRSGWLGWKLGTSQSLSGNLDGFFCCCCF